MSGRLPQDERRRMWLVGLCFAYVVGLVLLGVVLVVGAIARWW